MSNLATLITEIGVIVGGNGYGARNYNATRE